MKLFIAIVIIATMVLIVFLFFVLPNRQAPNFSSVFNNDTSQTPQPEDETPVPINFKVELVEYKIGELSDGRYILDIPYARMSDAQKLRVDRAIPDMPQAGGLLPTPFVSVLYNPIKLTYQAPQIQLYHVQEVLIGNDYKLLATGNSELYIMDTDFSNIQPMSSDEEMMVAGFEYNVVTDTLYITVNTNRLSPYPQFDILAFKLPTSIELGFKPTFIEKIDLTSLSDTIALDQADSEIADYYLNGFLGFFEQPETTSEEPGFYEPLMKNYYYPVSSSKVYILSKFYDNNVWYFNTSQAKAQKVEFGQNLSQYASMKCIPKKAVCYVYEPLVNKLFVIDTSQEQPLTKELKVNDSYSFEYPTIEISIIDFGFTSEDLLRVTDKNKLEYFYKGEWNELTELSE